MVGTQGSQRAAEEEELDEVGEKGILENLVPMFFALTLNLPFYNFCMVLMLPSGVLRASLSSSSRQILQTLDLLEPLTCVTDIPGSFTRPPGDLVSRICALVPPRSIFFFSVLCPSTSVK